MSALHHIALPVKGTAPAGRFAQLLGMLLRPFLGKDAEPVGKPFPFFGE
jgi:hypothetical protein